MKPGRNDPCLCGSGLKYKHCHLEMDEAAPDRRVEAAHAQYARQWSGSAANIERQGCYDWMADQLRPFTPRSVLDIGCGEGAGLLALMRAFGPELKAISLDENWACIEGAAHRLRDAGHDVGIFRRYLSKPIGASSHSLEVEGGKLPAATSSLSLVQADLLAQHDVELWEFLLRQQFDAVTVWLTGTHSVRRECLHVSGMGLASDAHYRLAVQNTTYELADRVLKQGGALQVVDRGEVPNSTLLREDVLNGHREQASVTHLDVRDLAYRVYREAKVGARKPMVVTPGQSGRIPDVSETAMLSILSVKR